MINQFIKDGTIVRKMDWVRQGDDPLLVQINQSDFNTKSF